MRATPRRSSERATITGVSDERLLSLHRQRQALAAKVVAGYPEPAWRAAGADGLAAGEGVVSSTWPQANDALSPSGRQAT
jgi:monoamine oxidase